jgi:hypothetical protein
MDDPVLLPVFDFVPDEDELFTDVPVELFVLVLPLLAAEPDPVWDELFTVFGGT